MRLGNRIFASVADVRSHAQRLVQLNVELFRAELREKGQQYGAAVGLFVGAAVLALYAFGLLLALIVVALALAIPLWLSLLIVTAVMFVIVVVLILIGRSRIAKARQSAMRSASEMQATLGQLRGGLKDTVGSLGARSGETGAGPPPTPPPSSSPPPGSSTKVGS